MSHYYYCGLILVWIICLCSNHSNTGLAPRSQSLKRQNYGWRQAYTTIPDSEAGGGQKSISVCQQPKMVPVVNKASLTSLSHIIPKFSQHFHGTYNGTGHLWQLLPPPPDPIGPSLWFLDSSHLSIWKTILGKNTRPPYQDLYLHDNMQAWLMADGGTGCGQDRARWGCRGHSYQ